MGGYLDAEQAFEGDDEGLDLFEHRPEVPQANAVERYVRGDCDLKFRLLYVDEFDDEPAELFRSALSPSRSAGGARRGVASRHR